MNRFLVGSRIWFLLAMVVAVPSVIFNASEALSDRNNEIRQWLPNDLQETRNYDWFLDHFGSEEFALISWKDATLADHRVSDLAARLNGSTEYFRDVLTGPDLLTELQHGRMKLSREEAMTRIQGSLLGPDLQTTGIVVRLTEYGQTDRHAAVETIRSDAAAVGIPNSSLHLGGPTVESVALDEQSEQSRYLLTVISLILSSLAAWRCLKSVALMLTVLLTAVFCGAASLAWVAIFGDQMNMIMVTMPTLVYVLAVSGAIHVAHYSQVSRNTVGSAAAMGHTFSAAWLPCVLTAVTTAIGLGSLALSHVTPVRMFGFYSAIGVLTSLPVILFVLPAALSFLNLPQARPESLPAVESKKNQQPTGRLQRFAESVIRHNAIIAFVGIAVMSVSIMGLGRLSTSVRIIDFFSPNSRVITDYRWLEENLGPLVPVEVVVKIPVDNSMRTTNRIDVVREVSRALSAMPLVDGVVSAATYVPDDSQRRGFAGFARRAAMERKLQNHREELLAAGYLAEDESYELWRISARVAALNDVDYGHFVEELKAVVQPVVHEHTQRYVDSENSIDVVYTGMVPLIYKAQRVLLEDLTTSFLSAFALIGVVMLVLMRGLRSGLISMLPNTFPAIIIFGLMGWAGSKIGVGAMITASVALGIAVDDTIHFMNWFRRGLDAGRSRRESILFAYEQCGKAMIQTTAICGLGMLAFAFSSFGPTAGFATLMVALLGAALLGDLVFLPAILASPLGRVFARNPTAAPTTVPAANVVSPTPFGVALAADCSA